MTIKAELIMETAREIADYIDKEFCVDVDIYDIAGLINYSLGSFIKIHKRDDDE